MEIIARYKSSSGKTTGYRVRHEGSERMLIYSVAGEIVNGMNKHRKLELKSALNDKFKLADRNYSTPLLDYISEVIDNEA